MTSVSATLPGAPTVTQLIVTAGFGVAAVAGTANPRATSTPRQATNRPDVATDDCIELPFARPRFTSPLAQARAVPRIFEDSPRISDATEHRIGAISGQGRFTDL